ncbi:hydrogenase maturation nickel metallochaperone HypA [Halocella sp. SP3-1]|uniref:hydrogenase maturation nickel metallochaperone HypA/HybF n=1 Tax=Halocella sp. SP3-1 TaxID=2382161 RepID=UPI000F75F145|nr:hydrogenase maturation nickel metallochaperone HypA [Halocella sp. SP3-1]AZO94213.1 hydrogenase maturation nickel metallochaperone HypA [Halocella sp. SP3-1]
MHELGIMFNVVKNVENFAKKNGITVIDTLVLQIGELSSVIPRYAKVCYPAAVEGTMLENTKLEIEILPGNCICNNCSRVFNYLEYKGICPGCESEDWELLGGREFNIKEIIAC